MTFDRLFKFMTKPLVAFIYFALVILLIAYWDKPIATYFYYLDLRHQLPVLSYITKLGSSYVYFVFFIALGCYARYLRDPQLEAKACFLLLSITIPVLICLVLKLLIGRARPNLYILDHIYGFFSLEGNANYWSLPSGHTTTIMSVMLGFAILWPRYIYAFLSLGAAVSLSRLFLTHHYLSDIMVAFYLVVLELGILLWVLRKKSWLTPLGNMMYNAEF